MKRFEFYLSSVCNASLFMSLLLISPINAEITLLGIHENPEEEELRACGTNTISNQIKKCCATLNSQLDVLQSDVDVSFAGTFTAIAAISINNTCDFSGTFTALESLSSQIETCCNTLINDFNGTFTAIAAISINNTCDLSGTFTALEACCNSIESKLDTDFNGTFTAIAAIPACDFAGSFTALAALSSQVETCCNTLINDFNGTFTALAGLSNQVAVCCNSIESKLDTDFNGTFTAIAGVSSQVTTCCNTLISDFNGTFTALEACCNSIESKLDTDFNGTFTAIAAIPTCDFAGSFTALAALSSQVAVCCNSIESKLDTDFNGTFTAIAAIDCTTNDLCAAIPITGVTTITTPGTYCLANSITYAAGDIITTQTSNVVLDLNGHYLNQQGSHNAITIRSTTPISLTNIVITNGFLSGFNGNLQVGQNGIFFSSTASGIYSNITINQVECSGFTVGGINVINVKNLLLDSCKTFTNQIGVNLVDSQDIIMSNVQCNNNITTIGSSLVVGAGARFVGLNTGINNVYVENSQFNDNGEFGINDAFDGFLNSNLYFNSCQFNNNNSSNFPVSNKNCGVSFTASSQLKFFQCEANGNQIGFNLLNAGGVSVADFTLENCLACANTGTGFEINVLSGMKSSLIGCVAQDNNADGFDFSASSGVGIIKNCVATNNATCGFNDKTGSLYKYVANSAQDNGTSPAPANVTTSTDTNYCLNGAGTQTGGFTAPYYQFARYTAPLSFTTVSGWDNISL